MGDDMREPFEAREAVQRGVTSPGVGGRRLLHLGLLVGLVIVVIYAVFEVVERNFLVETDMRVRHGLHIVRGVGTSLLVAFLITRNLLAQAPSLLSTDQAAVPQLAGASLAERASHRKETSADWFIQMRWVAIVAAATLVILTVPVARFLPSFLLVPLFVVIALLAAFNVWLAWLRRRSQFNERLLGAQVLVDLSALIALLHFSGGIENPLSVFAVFHVMIAGILLSQRHCLAVAVFVSLAFTAVALGEYTGVLEHYTLEIVPHGDEHVVHGAHIARYVVATCAVFWGVMFMTAFFVTRLAGQIRRDEADLERMAEQALSAQDLLENALDTTATGLRVVDGDLRVRWSNDKWEELFRDARGRSGPSPGVDRDDAARKTFVDGRSREWQWAGAPCGAQGGRGLGALSPQPTRHYAVTTAPLVSREGKVERVVELATDVTQRKREEEEIRRAEKLAAVGQLASNVIHELNNPIAILSAKARLLVTHHAGNVPQKVRDELGRIISLAERVASTTQGLLGFARPSLGTRESVCIDKVLESAIAFVRSRAAAQGVACVLDVQAGLAPVVANKNELEQVFVNLLINASDAMPGGGRLSVRAARGAGPEGHEPALVIQVRDSGAGMPPDVLARIFEPFFSTKGEGKGTGLGLPICLSLVEAHGGTIDARSEPGRGSVFTVRLPVVNEEASWDEKEGA